LRSVNSDNPGRKQAVMTLKSLTTNPIAFIEDFLYLGLDLRLHIGPIMIN